MHSLYQLSDGLVIQKKIKIGIISMIVLGLFVLVLVIPLTVFYPNPWVMILDILLTSSYLCYVYIFLFFFKKNYQYSYQFLAKIQHFPHQEIIGMVAHIDSSPITRLSKQVHEVRIDNDRVMFIEHEFISYIQEKKTYTFTLIENIVISVNEIIQHD